MDSRLSEGSKISKGEDGSDSDQAEGWKEKERREKMQAQNREVQELKDQLLDQVAEIIDRQNRTDPPKKMETFQIETASRTVLKQLT